MASRDVRWLDETGDVRTELSISTGNPVIIASAFPVDGPDSTGVDVAGRRGLAIQQTPGRAVVVWSPSERVEVRLGHTGSVDEALTIARSLAELDQTTWETSSQIVPDRPDDDCHSFFC